MITVDHIEWTWTIVNAAGLFFLGMVVRELRHDAHAASKKVLDALGLSNGRRGIWIVILLRHEALFLLLQGLLTLSGIAAIRRPNPTDPAALEATVTAGLVAIVAAIGMDIVTLLDLRDRGRIRDYPKRKVDA